MSKTQFTPGPWKQEPAHLTNEKLDIDENYIRIIAGEGFFIGGDGFEITGYMSTANARLIAAAPDMYDILNILQHTTCLPDQTKRTITSLLQSITHA